MRLLHKAWVSSLPEHLRFSEETLQVQLSMFETSSNTGAWCFCCMHVLHSSVALALNIVRIFLTHQILFSMSVTAG